jgi:hypothetical protein
VGPARSRSSPEVLHRYTGPETELVGTYIETKGGQITRVKDKKVSSASNNQNRPLGERSSRVQLGPSSGLTGTSIDRGHQGTLPDHSWSRPPAHPLTPAHPLYFLPKPVLVVSSVDCCCYF